MAARLLVSLLVATKALQLVWIGLCVGLDTSRSFYEQFYTLAPAWVYLVVFPLAALLLVASYVHRLHADRPTRPLFVAATLAGVLFVTAAVTYALVLGPLQTATPMYGGAAAVSFALSTYGRA